MLKKQNYILKGGICLPKKNSNLVSTFRSLQCGMKLEGVEGGVWMTILLGNPKTTHSSAVECFSSTVHHGKDHFLVPNLHL